MPVRQVNLNQVNRLFAPREIARVATEERRVETPTMDRFFPQSRRRDWNQPLIPLRLITRITKAVPLVLRGAPGVSLPNASRADKWIEPQDVSTFDAIGAVEFNNARMADLLAGGGTESQQSWADEQSRHHLDTHRLTADALCAQSLTGQVSYPIADKTGRIVEMFVVTFGTVQPFVANYDWTAGATTIGDIKLDLDQNYRLQQRRNRMSSRVSVGSVAMAAVYDKLEVLPNDNRTNARQLDNGDVRIGRYTLTEHNVEYYHPGTPDDSIEAGYKQVVGPTEVLLDDPNADAALFAVVLDNFKLTGSGQANIRFGVLNEMSEDGRSINQYAFSKPFPVPPVESMRRGEVGPAGRVAYEPLA